MGSENGKHDTLLLISLFVFSFLIRLSYLAIKQFDYWGDSYHHFYISWNSYITWNYTDFKNNQLIWLPMYHLIGVLIIGITQSTILMYFQILNAFIGSCSVIMVARIVGKMAENDPSGFISGLFLATSPVHIVYSTMNMPEIFAGFCFLGVIHSILSENHLLFYMFYIMAILTRYELWIMLNLMILFFKLFNSTDFFTLRVLLKVTTIFVIWLVLWSCWSFSHTKDPFYWVDAQLSALSWDSAFYGNLSISEKLRLYWKQLEMVIIIFLTTFSLIFRGARSYFHKYPLSKILLPLFLAKLIGNLFFNMIPLYDARYLMLDLHLLVLLVPGFLPGVTFFHRYFIELDLTTDFGWDWSRLVYKLEAILLIILISSSLVVQTKNLQNYHQKEDLLAPQYHAGVFLNKWIMQTYPDQSPNILIDSPVVAYYANLSPHQMISSEFLAGRNITHLIWTMQVRALVFEDVSYSNFSRIFPFIESKPINYVFNEVEFHLIFQYDGYVLDYGATNVFIYQLIIQ